MSKKAILVYEELNDSSAYTLSSWLRLAPKPALMEDIANLNGAVAYLFDYFFAKENAGSEISELIHEELQARYVPKKLSEQAVEIRARMSLPNFLAEDNKFNEYLKLLMESEEYIGDAFKDNEGRLAVSYAETLINLICKHYPEAPELKVREAVFLQSIISWAYNFRLYYGEAFFALKSVAFFRGVEEAHERIRSEILD